MESATGRYMPKIQELAELRKRELAEMRARVSSNPEKVERWFDKVIETSPAAMSKISCAEFHKTKCDGRDLNPGYQIGNLMS